MLLNQVVIETSVCAGRPCKTIVLKGPDLSRALTPHVSRVKAFAFLKINFSSTSLAFRKGDRSPRTSPLG